MRRVEGLGELRPRGRADLLDVAEEAVYIRSAHIVLSLAERRGANLLGLDLLRRALRSMQKFGFQRGSVSDAIQGGATDATR